MSSSPERSAAAEIADPPSCEAPPDFSWGERGSVNLSAAGLSHGQSGVAFLESAAHYKEALARKKALARFETSDTTVVVYRSSQREGQSYLWRQEDPAGPTKHPREPAGAKKTGYDIFCVSRALLPEHAGPTALAGAVALFLNGHSQAGPASDVGPR